MSRLGESLGDILRGIISHERTDPPFTLEEEDPPCPVCNGAGFLSVPFDFTKQRSNYVMPIEACRCQIKKDGYQTFENYDCPKSIPDLGRARQLVQQWSRGDAMGIVVLAGERGVGKTHLSRAACGVITSEVLWTTDGQVNDEIHNSFEHHSTSELLDWYATRRWFILDDFGLTSKTPAVESIFDRIIDSRIESVDKFGGRTLITTNLKPDQMSPRTASRLQDVRRVRSFIIDGPDYRQHPHGG